MCPLRSFGSPWVSPLHLWVPLGVLWGHWVPMGGIIGCPQGSPSPHGWHHPITGCPLGSLGPHRWHHWVALGVIGSPWVSPPHRWVSPGVTKSPWVPPPLGAPWGHWVPMGVIIPSLGPSWCPQGSPSPHRWHHPIAGCPLGVIGSPWVSPLHLWVLLGVLWGHWVPMGATITGCPLGVIGSPWVSPLHLWVTLGVLWGHWVPMGGIFG